jgi:hypothetical protein
MHKKKSGVRKAKNILKVDHQSWVAEHAKPEFVHQEPRTTTKKEKQ